MKRISVLIIVLAITGLLVNCGDFLSGGILDSDPNRATEVPIMEHLVALQPAAFGFYLGDIGSFAVTWMQQMAGVAQHWDGYEKYIVTASIMGGPWGQMYGFGGLIDQRIIQEAAAAEDRRIVVGIAKMYEALVIATGAFVWGDMPYTEAANDDISDPVYDGQQSVHNAVLNTIDSAISDFNAGQSFIDGSYDFCFGADTAKWIRAAHTLKARILLNWAEVNSGNYALALAEAQQGISGTDGNWQAMFSDTAGEENVWWQFEAARFGYVRTGAFFVNLLKNDNDPRLEFYLSKDDNGEYSGAEHASSQGYVSFLNSDTFGAKSWDFDMVSWEENQYIIAECQYKTGDEAGALLTLNETLAGIEARWGFADGSITRYAGISGNDLITAILKEKYKALFLNPQVWDDWKRTNYPPIVAGADAAVPTIPRRFVYPDDEENANASFPGYVTDGFFGRNPNDPADTY